MTNTKLNKNINRKKALIHQGKRKACLLVDNYHNYHLVIACTNSYVAVLWKSPVIIRDG